MLDFFCACVSINDFCKKKKLKISFQNHKRKRKLDYFLLHPSVSTFEYKNNKKIFFTMLKNNFVNDFINKPVSFTNLLKILGTGVLSIGALHAATEIFVRARHHLGLESKKPLCANFSSKQPKVIITGGMQGLGFELVMKFLKLGGYQIEIWDLKNEIENEVKRQAVLDALDKNAMNSSSSPSNNINIINFVVVDVSNVEQIQEACNSFLKKNNGDGPDLLILNAGVVARKSIGQFEAGEIQKCFATNVSVHAFELLNILLPKMMKNSEDEIPWRRSIVLISSVTSFSGFAYASEYCATKAALVSLGDSLRSEIRSSNNSSSRNNKNVVDVLTVCPYLIVTRMFHWCRPPFGFYAALNPKWVAEKIVDDGIRYRRSCLVLPWFFNLMPIVKWTLPEWCWLIADDLLDASSWLKPPHQVAQ